MLKLIIETFWFFLPAGVANMSPVLFKWLPVLSCPVDFNIKLRGKPLLGKNKTWRGLIVGIMMAILIVYCQKLLYPQMAGYSLVDYSTTNIFLLGFLFGFGALLGDMVKSLFKRQIGVAPGRPWFPFDQLDWVIGANILIYLYFQVSGKHILTSFIILGLLHPLTNIIGYWLKIKKNKW